MTITPMLSEFSAEGKVLLRGRNGLLTIAAADVKSG